MNRFDILAHILGENPPQAQVQIATIVRLLSRLRDAEALEYLLPNTAPPRDEVVAQLKAMGGNFAWYAKSVDQHLRGGPFERSAVDYGAFAID